MKSLIIAIIIILTASLTGCSYRSVNNDFEVTSQSSEKATVFFYMAEENPSNSFIEPMPIKANDILLGDIFFGKPLIKMLDPGTYKVYAKNKYGIHQIRRVSTFDFLPNQVYYIKMYMDHGLWVSSIRLEQTGRPNKI